MSIAAMHFVLPVEAQQVECFHYLLLDSFNPLPVLFQSVLPPDNAMLQRDLTPSKLVFKLPAAVFLERSHYRGRCIR